MRAHSGYSMMVELIVVADDVQEPAGSKGVMCGVRMGTEARPQNLVSLKC